jgi:hypothetical protein
MTGPITYAAVTVLTRDRLRQIRDALRAKLDTGTQVRDIERQMFHLADRAFRMLSAEGDTVDAPLQLYGPPFGDRISRYALMGAIGPDLPAYAALNARGASWLRDTLHKGTPDEHRARVLVGSTNLPLRIWTSVRARVEAEHTDALVRTAKLDEMRAALLGHFCHVAADVVTAPYVDDISFHLGTVGQPQLTRAEIVGAIDVEVSRALFRKGISTRGSDWARWWPSAGSVPGYYFEAWVEALEAEYGPGAVREGLGDYQARHASDGHPPLNKAYMEDGYSTFRNVTEMGIAWDLLDWMGALVWMFVPAIGVLPLHAALDQGSRRFDDTKPAHYNEDAAVYQLVVYPFAALGIIPIVTQIVLSFRRGAGTNLPFVLSWVSAGVQLAALISFFASLGELDEADDPRGAAWALLLVLPLVLEVVHIVLTFVRAEGDNRMMQLGLGSLVHIGLALLYLFFYWAWMHQGVSSLREPGDKGPFARDFILWFLIVGGLWIGTAALMRWVFTPTVSTQGGQQFVTGRRHHVRLFDDSTLYSAPSDASPTLADLHFPSGRRPLFKMWWTGAGAPTVACSRDTLTFDFGGGHTVVVHAPLAPMSQADYAAYLQRVVIDAGANANLHVERVHPDELDYTLPAGLTFSHGGDDRTTEADVTAHAADTAGLTEAEPFVLHHAPRRVHAVGYNRRGPSRDAEARVALNGAGTISQVAGSRTVTGDPGATPFPFLFQPGDLLEAPQGSGTQRVIVSVDSATRLTIATPFPAALVGSNFQRAALDRTVDAPAPAAWTLSPGAKRLELLASPSAVLGSFLRPGDTVRIAAPAGGLLTQDRVVVAVLSDRVIQVSRELDNPAGAGAAAFTRLAEEDPFLFRLVPERADATFGQGTSLLDDAADLGALLCMAAASHLLPESERAPGVVGSADRLEKAWQVFRNWNLDHRRVNEWQMLVTGGAVSEKRGNPAGADPALPPLEGGWVLRTPRGEPTANDLGWLQAMRGWVDMARRPQQDAHAKAPFRPGSPSNLELSRALAWLFDMRDPDPT